MNIRLVFSLIGKLLLIEGGLMIPSLAVSVYYGEPIAGFIMTILCTLTVGGVMIAAFKPTVQELRAREGFIVVALAWLFVSVFGALPYVFTDAIPTLTDAFFESVSGFTTTGATILSDIEAVPKGLLFWR